MQDHGPSGWHRDIEPNRDGPLSGLQADMAANGVGTVQWNIALYDDDVLWIVPGSHRRRNTDAEIARCLKAIASHYRIACPSNSRPGRVWSIPMPFCTGE